MIAEGFFGNLEFHNIIMRASFALVTSLFLTFLIGRFSIGILAKFQKHGQPIREDGPKSHITEKAGTPTMGGLMIILTTLVGTLMWGSLQNEYLLICIFTLVTFGFLGFLDDYKKIKKRSSGGMSAKMKFLIQLALACVFCYLVVEANLLGSGTILVFPSLGMINNIILDIGIIYYIFASLVVVGSSNAVNLTDGLDGLAILPICICALFFGLFALVCGDMDLSNYFRLQYIPRAGEIIIIAFALLGAGLGFLWYNAKPAEIFMGDVGSLALGALLGIMSVIVKREMTLAIVGGLFVIETVSVMIQVLYFKKTKRRIFLMAPLHHHFEKKGWSETKVVIRFWILSLIFAIIGLATL